MIITSKQRAYLRSLATTIDPVYQIGKSSLTTEFIEGINEVLEARELIKVSVLKNCADDPRELAEVLSERTRSTVVSVMGKKITLFRRSKDKSRIVLPGEKAPKTIAKKTATGTDKIKKPVARSTATGSDKGRKTAARMSAAGSERGRKKTGRSGKA